MPHGLYDPLLGPTDSKNTSPCPTCGNLYLNCPGHAGHVELCAPVYQPLTFPKLLILLRIKCLACHRFRLDKIQSKIFAAKFHLIDCGRIQEALELDDNLSSVVSNDANIGPDGKSIDTKVKKKDMLVNAGRSITLFLDKKLASTPMTMNNKPVTLTSHERSVRRQLVKDFLSACGACKKCNNCRAHSPRIRHDNYNKVFQSPLSDKMHKLNTTENIKIIPASAFSELGTYPSGSGWASDDSDMEDDEIEEDNEPAGTSTMSDNEDEYDESAMLGHKTRESTVLTSSGKLTAQQRTAEKASKPDKFMHALEVEAQAQITWQFESFLCTKVFGNAHAQRGVKDEKGYGIFFMRAIPVPPSRFRPPMVMGTMTVEHAQNHYLNKVLELNDRLRVNFATVQAIDSEGADSGKTDDKDNIQARAISTWIDLQTTVNCYIDSSKDPSGGAAQNVPNGIRQLLEKKEGMFRK